MYCWLHVQFEIMGFLDPLAYLDIPNVLPAPISSKILTIAQELIQMGENRNLSMMELSVQLNYQGASLLKLLLDNFKQTASPNIFPEELETLMPAVKAMKQNLGKSLSIENLAQSVSMSVPTFFRRFKRAFKITPYAQLEKLRMHEAVNLLCINKRSIDETSEILGYCDRFQFSKVFKRVYGKSPSQYRQSFYEGSHLC
ncbi:MAG: AraC family transcriptional regulator [Victivallaceae bacterium]